MANDREKKLGVLFDASVKALLDKVEAGEATASDYKNIIQLLKDNNITCEIRKGSPLAKLAEVLPFTAAEMDQSH